MSYKVEAIVSFEKQARRLKKKFPSLKEEIGQLIDDLGENPLMGVALRSGFYKIRLGIKSKGTGKRGGARVITYVKIIAETVYLIAIYDKSEQSSVDDATLDELLTEIPADE